MVTHGIKVAPLQCLQTKVLFLSSILSSITRKALITVIHLMNLTISCECSDYCGSNLESNSIFMTYIVLLCLIIRMEWFVSQLLGMLIRIWWVPPPPQSTEIQENCATMLQINYNDSTVLAHFPYTQNQWTYRSPLVAGTRRDIHIRPVL